MLLFSTMLKIKNSLTPDIFIEEVLKWNQNSPHLDQVVRNCNWNGERNIKFGDDKLWIDIEEYKNENIIAIRYEKQDENKVLWNTDFIMNFNELKLSIQLYRSYTEDSLCFSDIYFSPFFIKQLIDKEYLEDDYNLKISYNSSEVNSNNIYDFITTINNISNYSIPIIYISKDILNLTSIDSEFLAYKLKGIAHVFVQNDISINTLLNNYIYNKIESNREIDIYFPNGQHKAFSLSNYKNYEQILCDIERDVTQYSTLQIIDSLYTWDGVINAILSNRLNLSKEASEYSWDDIEKVIYEAENLSDENKKKTDKIYNLETQIYELKMYNEKLRRNLNLQNIIPILKFGEESDLFDNEIKEFVLEILDKELHQSKDGSRRKHILEDIIKSNDYQNILKNKRDEIKKIFGNYWRMSPKISSSLKKMGFSIKEDGKHYKLIYCNDNRYTTIIPKTTSDSGSFKKIINYITKKIF